MDDDEKPTDTRVGRILEAVLISALTAAATKLIEHISERMKRRKRTKGKRQ